jgi:hypothetical protein
VVLALFEQLSADYATQAALMAPGPWRHRFLFVLKTSLSVLAPERDQLAAFTSAIGDPERGLFTPASAAMRRRVQAVFVQAVEGASDAPRPTESAALGRVLYLVHVVVILWWLLDKSRGQHVTSKFLSMLERLLPVASLTYRLPPARSFICELDALVQEGLFGE